MTTPHPNAEILRAIADGKNVQWRRNGGSWVDWDHRHNISPLTHGPVITADGLYTWRVKPETIRYRVGLTTWNKTKIASSAGFVVATDPVNEKAYENRTDFVRWLGDWQEVEL